MGLMALIALLAFSIAGLRDATETWASAAFTVAILILAAATLLAGLRRGRDRASWGGFALFGWIYVMLTFGSALLGARRPLPPPLLMTPERLEQVQVSLAPNGRDQASPRQFIRELSQGDPALTITTYYVAGTALPPPPAGTRIIDVRSFHAIAHSLGAIAFALIGGTFGWFAGRPNAEVSSA